MKCKGIGGGIYIDWVISVERYLAPPSRTIGGSKLAYGKDPSFIRGLLISFLILLPSLVIALIPVVGVFFALSLVPYLSGAVGARFAHPKDRAPLSLTCAMTWSIIETAILLAFLSFITKNTPMGLVIDAPELMMITMIWLANIIFMLLGSFHPWRDPFADLK